ncbi:OmpH family outer membrane protein [Flavobacterium sp.]|uniref:OmpH family outer membrane protein n=1 Tax=Flavobacterium sp. TaxID=239 RepID=UPI003527BA50
MKKILVLATLVSTSFLFSQSRGMRIAYIDMDYILSKVSSYAEANNQLEQKAVKWKQEIEVKKAEIDKLKEALNTERALLTKELINEREEEITFLEQELLEYQEKKFGVQGDLIVQKTTLVKPVQDQVFNAIQDIAEQQKYDFVFDKSSDLTMLFANQRHDISDKVIRIISRTEKREELTKKQLKAQEAQEALENMEDENPELAARREALEAKKAAREKMLEERKAAREKMLEDRKAEAEARRQKALDERNAKKNGTDVDTTSDENKETEKTINNTTDEVAPAQTTAEEKRAKAEAERQQKLEDRKRELEERRNKILEEREAAKKAKENQNSTE